MPGSLDFIQCINGIDRKIFDYQSVEGWDNPEIADAVKQIDTAIGLHDTEIAYRLESAGRYFAIRTVSDGYDYTFYDNQFRELDGLPC